MSAHMNLTLKVWRQKNDKSKGQFVTVQANDIADDMSFLEMLDIVNDELTRKGEDPIYMTVAKVFAECVH
jgi:succinate dehydrogenase / fumarate reductase iron-sulfur subunit